MEQPERASSRASPEAAPQIGGSDNREEGTPNFLDDGDNRDNGGNSSNSHGHQVAASGLKTEHAGGGGGGVGAVRGETDASEVFSKPLPPPRAAAAAPGAAAAATTTATTTHPAKPGSSPPSMVLGTVRVKSECEMLENPPLILTPSSTATATGRGKGVGKRSSKAADKVGKLFVHLKKKRWIHISCFN